MHHHEMDSTTYVVSDLGSLQNKHAKNKVILSLYGICMARIVCWHGAAVWRISANIFTPGFKSNSETDPTKTSHMHVVRNLSSTSTDSSCALGTLMIPQ